ncbi:MAG: glycine C-acetyltransferase [Bdellovibrionaceae bacterium]|nr:glycine C-acetyltransferase [Pseudobdellovibrionaceae bacterium]|tara:strand:- start:23689 stop:24885 length:1197 start_codon:yes stop_codon:yes gene_type:complete
MARNLFKLLETEIDNLQAAGLFHDEYSTGEASKGSVKINSEQYVDLTCTDYLGLAKDKEVIEAIKSAVDTYGAGVGNYRFISGTGQIHTELEADIKNFLEKEDSALFTSLYQANIGLLESLVNQQDYIFTNLKCHPSIIDGILLTKAKKFYWGFADLTDLEDQLKRSPQARFRFIFTEGILSNDGSAIDIKGVCDLAEKYDAIVVLHDTNGLGVSGNTGKGAAETTDTLSRVDIITGSFSKALSGVELGFVSGPKNLIRWLKQKSKPYVFSTSPAPPIVAAAKKSLEIASRDLNRRQFLQEKVDYFRDGLQRAQLRLIKSDHPIVGIISNDAVKTQKIVDSLFSKNVFVTGLCYPVVPKGFARICCNITLHHSYEQLDHAIDAIDAISSATSKYMKKN